MIATSFWTLTLAVAIGTILAFWHLRASDEGTTRPPFLIGLVHAMTGLLGLAALLLVPNLGGGSGFGKMAAWVFGIALISGVVVLLRRRNGPAAMMAIHSSIAVTGYVLLLAWHAL